ncbi:MAG: DNA polymerase III subunit beta [Chromatiales bacterium]|nr:DNA polymerase III subunit beta [Chromatiales bacterium]
MKFTTSRAALLKPLQAVIGVVERRQTMPVLANVLLAASQKGLEITGTDLEVELVAHGGIDKQEVEGEITVPGRKLLDICKALPDGADIRVVLEGDRLKLRSGRTQFVLSTLPAADFPVIEDLKTAHTLELSQDELLRLLEKTHFAMAQQDVRYYLNGLMLETGQKRIRAVATDGHRLALCELPITGQDLPPQQVIIPRKGVLELQRLLGGSEPVRLAIGSNHVRATIGDIRFTSKLIDGRFPDYERVIPKPDGNRLEADRDSFRAALQRAAILSNEKYRGIRLELCDDAVRIQANNPDQEEARDEVAVAYKGERMEIGFNVNYLLDALGAVDGEQVTLGLIDPNSSCLIESEASPGVKYVVMPMRL